MTVFTKTAVDIFAAQDASGTARKVSNHDVQVWGTEVERVINTALGVTTKVQGGWNASGGSFPGSGTAEKGDTWIVTTAGTVDGVVFRVGDMVVAITDNASTTTYSGNWARFAAALDPVVHAVDSGAGTSNDIAITASRPVSPDGGQLISFVPAEDTNGSPVTLQVSDSSGAVIGPYEIKTAAGNDPNLTDDTTVVVQLVGNEWVMLSDQATAQLLAEAEAAAEAAEDAADRAQSYSAMLSADKIKFATVADLLADEIMSYTPGSGLIEVGPGDIIEAQGLRYEVMASGATDAHIKTAGGVRLRHISAPADRFLPEHQLITLTGPDVVLGVVGDRLIGASGTTLYGSEDGSSWSVIQDTGHALGSTQAAIYQLEDGEVLLNTSTTLVRSTGWAANPATATWSVVLTAGTYPTGQSRFHQGWGVSVAGQYILVAEYGSPKPNAHCTYLSTDYGVTFTTVFDQRYHFPIDSGSDAHLHGCCIDLHHGAIPRLWQLSADSGQIAWFYSDDLGSSWTRLPDDSYPTVVNESFEPPNYVVVTATPWGIVTGSDSKPDGVGYIPRDSQYTNSPRIRTVLAFGDDEHSLTHVAQSHAILDEWVFILFNPSGAMVSDGVSRVPARITATNSKSGETRIVWQGEPDQHSVSRIDYFQEALWVRSGTGSVIKIPLYQTDTVYTLGGIARDSGNVLGGLTVPRYNSLALHPSSKVGHESSVALVPFAQSTAVGQLIIAPFADIAGSRAIAISPGLAALNAPEQRIQVHGSEAIGIGFNATVDGSAAIGVGDRATAEGTAAIAIGRQAAASQTTAIAVGYSANADGINAMAVGREASATETNAAAVGYQADATGARSLALGFQAKAPNPDAVALPGATTTATSQLNIGNRYMQSGTFTSNRLTPPEGQVAEWWHDTGSGLEKRFRGPNGTVMRFVVEAV